MLHSSCTGQLYNNLLSHKLAYSDGGFVFMLLMIPSVSLETAVLIPLRSLDVVKIF